MPWHLARISRQPGRVTVTLPDAPSIRLDAGTLEQAMEMGQQALDAHLDAPHARASNYGSAHHRRPPARSERCLGAIGDGDRHQRDSGPAGGIIGFL